MENAGCSDNENILEYVVGGFSNCYNSDYYSVKTASVITDTSSKTFVRAPGKKEHATNIKTYDYLFVTKYQYILDVELNDPMVLLTYNFMTMLVKKAVDSK